MLVKYGQKILVVDNTSKYILETDNGISVVTVDNYDYAKSEAAKTKGKLVPITANMLLNVI